MQFDKIIVKILRTLSFVMFVMMICVVFAQVIQRYFTDDSLAWSDELSRLLLVWVSFMGVAMIHYSDAGHPAVTFIVDKIPPNLRKVLNVALNLTLSVCLVAVCIAGIKYTISNHRFVSPILHYPNSVKYAVVPLTMALMAIKSIQRTITNFISLMGKNKGGN